MDSTKDLLKNKEKILGKIQNRQKYVTQEFQDYGYRIALKLGELDRVSLYIKLAKNKPRAHMEQAYSFAIDYPNAKNRGRLFLWKLKDLQRELDEKKKKEEAEAKEEQPALFDTPEDEKPKKKSKKTKSKAGKKKSATKKELKKTESKKREISESKSDETKIKK